VGNGVEMVSSPEGTADLTPTDTVRQTGFGACGGAFPTGKAGDIARRGVRILFDHCVPAPPRPCLLNNFLTCKKPFRRDRESRKGFEHRLVSRDESRAQLPGQSDVLGIVGPDFSLGCRREHTSRVHPINGNR
jgi:hypothetical protein